MIKNFLLFCLLFLYLSCHHQKIEKTHKSATPDLKEMIGQMIMIGFRGFTINEVSEKIKTQIKEGKVGGIVLFDYDVVNKVAKRNIRDPEQVKELILQLQKLSAFPLLVAVDQEGGRVSRLKPKYGFPASVSNKYLGQINNLDTTKYYAQRNAASLSSLGFNVNFAPAVDLEINSENPVIGKIERSYSADPNIVIDHSQVWINEHSDKGIISTLKHFPGHGSSDTDSHYGISDITKYWNEIELLPFEKLLGTNRHIAVMTAHVVNKNLDKNYPATLSAKIIKGILRDKWNYQGIVFSDDLQMKAVNEIYDFETIVQKSISAGVDILVTGNNLEYNEDFAEQAINTIVKMVDEDLISEERIKRSYERILVAKKKLGLIE